MDYPAYSNPDILTVGSIDQSGLRSNSSGYAPELDVVAPVGSILSTLPSNSTGLLSGTSMAAPHVSGVAALILAVNPCLTREAVVGIIERTCQKIKQNSPYVYSNTPGRPHGSWNGELGYGLVDAGLAVDLARTLYLQNINETGTNNYLAYRVRAGKNVSPVSNTAVGDYNITNGANVTIRAKEEISFEDGFEAEAGSTMNAFIETSTPNCNEWSPPILARQIPPATAGLNLPHIPEIVQLDDDISVFPSPFREKLTVNFRLRPNTEAKVVLTDMYGVQRSSAFVPYTNGAERAQLENLGNLTPGLYILTLQRGSKVSTHKIVKYE